MLRSRNAMVGTMAAALLALTGCGSTTTEDPNTPPPADETGRVPPAPPPDKPGSGEGVVFAVDRLFLGETDRNGTASTEAWKQFGFNLDGKISDATSKDLCKPVGTATASSVYTDGAEGIDNSFGKNILGVITGLVMSPSAEVSASIADGGFTVMVQIEGLGADAEYNPLLARLHVGADLGAPPAWDGNDRWPIVPEFLNDPTDPNSSKVQFPKSYLVENTWVSGTNTNLNLSIAVGGYNLNLPITNAVFAMDISADRNAAANGTIAGILPTEQLISELEKIVGAIQPELCEGSAAENLYNLIRNASDIMADGTQDPNQTCNGISIGIGFSAQRVQIGDIAEPATPGEDPCAAAPAGG